MELLQIRHMRPEQAHHPCLRDIVEKKQDDLDQIQGVHQGSSDT